MAANCNENIYPDLKKHRLIMTYAEMLVDYLLLQTCPNYMELERISFSDNVYNAYTPIANAFCFLDNKMETAHQDLYDELEKANFVKSGSYERFSKILGKMYFSEGFDAKYFLIYCVNLWIMQEHFYRIRTIGNLDLAEIHIYQYLKESGMSDGGWDAIHTIAENYEKMLLHSKNEPTLLNMSLVSNESKYQDKELEEVSEDSNTLQIEEQGVSSGNVASNLEQLKECECFIHCSKAYQKYPQYFSKSRSEKGSLKEPESSSEDSSSSVTLEDNTAIDRLESENEQAPDTSYDDQGLILIVSDFKKKMDLLWK